MIVDDGRHRYASLAHQERGEAMTPRELVEDVIRRQTDGSLTFTVEEDERYVSAMLRIDGQLTTYVWSKRMLADNCSAADDGLRHMFARLSAHA